jgi:hypothetical protein
MERNLVIDRSSLPRQVLEWLESDKKGTGVLVYHEEDDRIILERLENIDPQMLTRVRRNVERYRSALQRLSES